MTNTSGKMSVTDPDLIYENYAKHFVLTGNKQQSALAAGVPADSLETFLEQAEFHPEVMRVIAEDDVALPDFDDPSSVRSAILKKLWKEANYRGVGSQQAARISALKTIGEVTGIEAPKKVDLNAGQGGLMLVPVLGSDEWEAAAAAAQQSLKETARA